MTACTYCGCEIEAHDPVYVAEREGDQRVPAGQFCNYGCLWAHIDDAGLTEGTSCEWEPTT